MNEINCEVCGDNPWTELVDDQYCPHPVHMCTECADDHYYAAEEGQLA